MLIVRNIFIKAMVLDLILIHFFQLQIMIGKKLLIFFGVDNSSSILVDNKKKYILVLGKGPKKELNYTTITSDAKYSIKFSISQRKLCLSLHYNESNSCLFVNASKVYYLK